VNYTCNVCGKNFEKGYVNEINGEQLFACSNSCMAKLTDGLFEKGKPLQSWSRVTGYLQSTDGWNPGKVAELRDRYRDNHYFPERGA